MSSCVFVACSGQNGDEACVSIELVTVRVRNFRKVQVGGAEVPETNATDQECRTDDATGVFVQPEETQSKNQWIHGDLHQLHKEDVSTMGRCGEGGRDTLFGDSRDSGPRVLAEHEHFRGMGTSVNSKAKMSGVKGQFSPLFKECQFETHFGNFLVAW